MMYKILHIPTAYIVGNFPWSNSINADMTIYAIEQCNLGYIIFKTITSAKDYLASRCSYDTHDDIGCVILFKNKMGDFDIKIHEFEIVEVNGV